MHKCLEALINIFYYYFAVFMFILSVANNFFNIAKIFFSWKRNIKNDVKLSQKIVI